MGTWVVARSVRTLVPVAAVLLVAVAASWPHWTAPVAWTPDGLYYEAQALELGGMDAKEARERVFRGQLGRSVPDTKHRLEDEQFIEHTAPFYRRRWLVPGLGAALHPVFGERSLLIVSLLGYVLAGPLLYLLLRRRFAAGVSAAVTGTCLLLSPLLTWSAHPLTDSWGVALVTASLLAASLVLDRGVRWLPAWVLAVLALSFTRDASVALVVGAAWFALRSRTRPGALLALSGAAAAAPAPLLFHAPLREHLAVSFSHNSLAPDTSWGYVLGQYWPNLTAWLDRLEPARWEWPFGIFVLGTLTLLALGSVDGPVGPRLRRAFLAVAVPYIGLVLVAAAFFDHALNGYELNVGLLFAAGSAFLFLPRNGDPLLMLLRGGLVAALLYLTLLPQWTAYRLELVLLPFVAFGLARAADRWPRKAPSVAPAAA